MSSKLKQQLEEAKALAEEAKRDAEAARYDAAGAKDQSSRLEARIADQLRPRRGRRVFDPDLTANLETNVSESAPSEATSGPNRLSLVVPYDRTILSLGDRARDASRTVERGIRGETDEHVHWLARDTATLVRLGSPGEHAADGSEAGYCMHTNGTAWQSSKLSHGIVSREGGVVAHAKGTGGFAALQSTHGSAEVVAHDRSTLAAGHRVLITADSGLSLEELEDGKPHRGEAGNFSAMSYAKLGLTLVDVLTSAEGLYRTFNPRSQAADRSNADWVATPNIDRDKLLLDSAKLLSTIGRQVDSSAHWSGASSVDVASSGSFSAAGKISASMYGHASASVTSLLSAGVLGGTASLKGLSYTSVWGGREVSVKGRQNAKMEAETGTASVRGNKGLELSSFAGPVVAQGKQNVRLASTEGQAYVFGATAVTCSAGQGSGFSMHVEPAKIELGKASRTSSFADDPGIADDCVLGITSGQIHMQLKETRLRMQDSDVRIDASDAYVMVKGNELKVEAAKVLLG